MHSHPPIESSATLRALVRAKRERGQLTDATILARLGARIATHESIAAHHDEVSRLALTRYLELMPDDAEVRLALEKIAPPPSRPMARRWLIWLLFMTCGISTAGAIHLNGFPVDGFQMRSDLPPASLAVAKVKSPPVALTPAASAVVTVKSEVATPIVIRAVGDVVLGSNFPRYRLPGENEKKRMASLRNELRNADLVVGNLEGVLYDHGKSHKDMSKPGLFSFRMPEGYAATLREMGFDVLSLANNHSMDFGAAGLESTIRALKAEGIHPVGVPGAEMATIKIRNTTVAFLNYSYLPAFARIDDEQRISAEIKHARAEADLVVVTVHAGKEGVIAIGAPSGDEYFMDEYRGDIRKFSHLAIDFGASAVFGHGPHVVRPYEIYKGQPIFFSLGNFVGYHSLSTRGKLANSIIAEVRFSPKGKLLGAGVIPLRLDRSGIPAADYGAANLNILDGLLAEQLEKRPVLELAMPSTAEEAIQVQSSPAKTASLDSPSQLKDQSMAPILTRTP